MRSLPPLFFLAGEGEAPGRKPSADVIGHDEATWLVVRSDGSVVSSDPHGLLPTRFVAPSTGEFTEVLDEFRSRWLALADMDDEQAEVAASRLVSDIETAHPEVVRDQESWWSVLLEQVSAGLL